MNIIVLSTGKNLISVCSILGCPLETQRIDREEIRISILVLLMLVIFRVYFDFSPGKIRSIVSEIVQRCGFKDCQQSVLSRSPCEIQRNEHIILPEDNVSATCGKII